MGKKSDIETALSPFGRVVASPRYVPPAPTLELYSETLDSMAERLGQKGAKSLVVVGPVGVGKSTLLRALFARLAAQGHTVLQTSTSSLVAGMKYIGEWQQRLQELMDVAKASRRVVVYFEDIDQTTTTGTTDGGNENFSTHLRSAVESGTIALVGETTSEALVSGLEREPSFRRSFATYLLKEPTLEQTKALVRSALSDFERRRGTRVTLSEETLDFALELTSFYSPGVAAPGRFFEPLWTLLETRQRPPAKNDTSSETPEVELQPTDFIDTLVKRTGLPRWLLDDRRPLDLTAAREFFQKRIIGQKEAVDAVLDLVTLVKAGLTDASKPLGVLMFVGPTGVGKTEIAKALAQFLFGSEEHLVRLDMSEYKEYSSYERLTGSAGGDPTEREGVLTRKLRQQPFSVVLLDEFEKAHPNVYDLMLQLFDDGRLTSGKGEAISFRQAIIIMTSNLGAGPTEPTVGFLGPKAEHKSREIRKALELYYRPEFLNRIDKIVVFRSLDISDLQSIAERELEKVLQRSGITRRQIDVALDDSVVPYLIKEGFSPAYGARPLKRAIERRVLLPMARRIVAQPLQPDILRVRVHKGKIAVQAIRHEPDTEQTWIPTLERDLSLDDARQRHSVLQDNIAQCRASVDEAGLVAHKQALLDEMQQTGFWEQSERRHTATSSLRDIEALLDEMQRLELQHEELGQWLESIERRRPALTPDSLVRAGDRLLELERRARLLGLRLESRGAGADADAFVRLQLLRRGDEPRLELLVAMYEGWAKNAGLECAALHRSVVDGTLARVTLAFAGPAAHGILAGEHGLHRFTTRERGRRATLVRVSVFPGPATFPESDSMQLDTRRRRDASPEVSAIDTETLRSVQVNEVNDEGIAATYARRWLAAELAHTDDGQEDRLVRVYTLEGDREIRDVASGVRTSKVDRILQGDLFDLMGPTSK